VSGAVSLSVLMGLSHSSFDVGILIGAEVMLVAVVEVVEAIAVSFAAVREVCW